MDKIGLIAGSSRFPINVAIAARKRGVSVYAVALKEETHPELEAAVDKICWISIGELGKAVDFLKENHIKRAVMAGKVRLSHIYSKSVKPDGYLKNLLTKAVDKRGDTLLMAVANFLDKIGVRLLDCALFLKDDIVKKGALTKIRPTKEQLADIEFAKPIVKAVAQLRIGQTIVVKNGTVLAVEAFEGTNEAIRRGGELGRGVAMVVKVSKPGQDMRFDVPVVGTKTLEVASSAGIRAIGVEAGSTLLLDHDKVVAAAAAASLSIYGL